MGARVEGKIKKKSIKANVTSKFGSKRKASRMGKKVKKGKMGPNTEFITRSSALKRLQITLKDFRRLCILKGIYPRVPVKGLKGNDKVYYDIKDISYIMHEPLLQKFRDFKAFMKKIRKAAGRNQFGEARRKDELKPQISLDHLVKERYPRFIDALRDLDDALCMIHLFASLPSTGRITSDRTASCSLLVKHWQYYISKTKSLYKVFVSVKGVYFQSQVMGEFVTWIVPHQFTQAIPKDVDVRVMMTFLEFYEVFLHFVLFKLYSMSNLNYPPVVDKSLDQEGCFLLALKADKLVTSDDYTGDSNDVDIDPSISSKPNQATQVSKAKLVKLPSELLKRLEDDDDEEEDEETGVLTVPLSEALTSINRDYNEEEEEEQQVFSAQSVDRAKRLFHNLVFFVNREVPLEWMQLSILSFGGKVGWDGSHSPIRSDNESITHQIVDRPQQGVQTSIREYIQPQWVFDCINAQIILPVLNYRPGCKLPPHLSPFTDDDKEGYLPRYREEIRKLQLSGGDQVILSAVVKENNNSMLIENAIEDDEENEEVVVTQKKMPVTKKISENKGSGNNQAVTMHKQQIEADSYSDLLVRKGTKGVVFKMDEQFVSEVIHADATLEKIT
jgi:pescadillo protein